MGLCEFLRLLHHQYTFFFLKNQKKLHNAFLMNKLQQKKTPYVENMIHVEKLIFANYYVIYFLKHFVRRCSKHSIFQKIIFLPFISWLRL